MVFDQAQADLAAEAIQDVAALLELHDLERRSYLSLVRGTIEPPVAEVH